MGTVAIAQNAQDVVDNRRVVEATITGSASYATGGDTIDLTELPITQVWDMVVEAGATADMNQDYSIALSADKTKIVWFTAGSQPTAATDLSGETFKVRIYGT